LSYIGGRQYLRFKTCFSSNKLNGREKMKNKLNKPQLITAIVLIFLMASSALTIMHEPIISAASAYTPLKGEYGGSYFNITGVYSAPPAGTTPAWSWTPIAYLSVSPGTIGKGQQLLVNMWTTPPSGANRCRVGYSVTFTKPDGTTDTVANLNSYVADGTSWFDYYPDQVGNWTAVFTAPSQYYPAGWWLNGNLNGSVVTGVAAFGGGTTTYPSEFYGTAVSEVCHFTVQQDFVASWSSALPTNQYWSRPISMNNREWSSISGNYPWVGYFGGGSMSGKPDFLGPYITGSNTAHILWSWQQVNTFPAGVIGGEAGQFGNKASPTMPSVIFEGRAYATQTVQWYNGSFISCAICYDLQSGKIYYEIPTAAPFNGITPTFIDYSIATSGEVLDSGDTNTYTANLMTLSGSLLYTINPATGAILYNVTAPVNNATAGTYLTGTQHNGYVLSFQNLGTTAIPNYRIINWTTYPPNLANGTARILSNITSTFGSASQIDWNAGMSISQVRFTEGNLNGGGIIGYNLLTGQMQFNVSTGDLSPFNAGTAVADGGRYYCVMENMQVWGFSDKDGSVLWKTQTEYPWGDFWGYSQASDGQTFIAIGYGGVYAFNETSGAIEWIYKPVSGAAFETPYVQNGTALNPGTGTPFIANGICYIDSNEHTPSAPYTRGWCTYAINMTDGSLIYRLDEPMVAGPMSDGYTLYQDGYDGIMYVAGRGPSITTVSAPQASITAGTGAIITGTVLDQSAAQPNTPCVSESSMGDYMSYIHLQTTWPGWSMANVTGVPVSIDAVDPNGNFMHIATVTSDATGHYGFTWMPTLAGDYKISATFGGSNSYGASWAQTYANVAAAAPTATSTPTQTTQPTLATSTDLMTYTAAAAIAVIIAIAIATVLMLRTKRA
jgi:hypothetical protein